MKERPILFSGPMVRAILNGAKTQTRRVVKLKGGTAGLDMMCPRSENEFVDIVFGELEKKCPYGQPGDLLWVKETHRPNSVGRVMSSMLKGKEQPDCYYRATHKGAVAWRWKPSIFMRRQYSRISLEIVSVRVERLQNISDADAVAEGIEPIQMPSGEVVYHDYLETGAVLARPVSSYATLWERINGIGTWSTNPWVWVVEFKKL